MISDIGKSFRLTDIGKSTIFRHRKMIYRYRKKVYRHQKFDIPISEIRFSDIGKSRINIHLIAHNQSQRPTHAKL